MIPYCRGPHELSVRPCPPLRRTVYFAQSGHLGGYLSC
ncbi:unnamed protein product, partial [Staurois parvus]